MIQSISSWTTIGFSGHRRLEQPAAVQEGLKRALDRLSMGESRLAAITSAASGSDTIFLEEIDRRAIPFFLVLPFSTERFRKDFSESDWSRVSPMLGRALNTVFIEELESDHEAYLEAGIRVVDQSDVIVAVWDGEPAAGVGGTGDIVGYSRALGKPLILIDPSTGELTEERLGEQPSATPTVSKAASPFQEVSQEFQRLDQLAVRRSPAAKILLLRLILLHLAASAISITAANFNAPLGIIYATIFLKVSALLWALVLVRWHHRAHHEWLHSRRGAELCRAYLSIWKIRRHPCAEPSVFLPDCERLAQGLRILWYLDSAAAIDLQSACARYKAERILEQHRYFSGTHSVANRWNVRLRRAATVGTVAAIIASGGTVLFLMAHQKGTFYSILKTLSMLLPLLSAAFLSLIAAQDLSRRSNHYQDIAAKLERLSTKMDAVRSWSGLWRVVSETETLLLNEVLEWQVVVQYAGGSH